MDSHTMRVTQSVTSEGHVTYNKAAVTAAVTAGIVNTDVTVLSLY